MFDYHTEIHVRIDLNRAADQIVLTPDQRAWINTLFGNPDFQHPKSVGISAGIPGEQLERHDRSGQIVRTAQRCRSSFTQLVRGLRK